MIGYKAFREINGQLVTQSDTSLEIGKEYENEGPVVWNKNGFHFCTNIEDTFRYMHQYDDNIVIAEVVGTGEIIAYDDEYNGNYDMRASSKIRVLRVLSRQEVLARVIKNGEVAICKMIESSRLNQEEINALANRSRTINEKLRYYHMGDKEVYSRKLKKTE